MNNNKKLYENSESKGEIIKSRQNAKKERQKRGVEIEIYF